MPTGTFQTWSKVAALIVELTKNRLGFASTFSNGMDLKRDFNEGPPGGNSVRVQLPFQGTLRTGWTYAGQSPVVRAVTVTADTVKGFDLNFDPDEIALYIDRDPAKAKDQFLMPLASQLANFIDLDCAQFAKIYTSMITGALGTTPSTSSTYNAPSTRIEEKGAIMTANRRGLLISPQMMESWVNGTPNIMQLFTMPEAKEAFRLGMIGKYGDFNVFKTNSCPSHTTGVIQTQASLTCNGAGQSGSTFSFNCTSGDTFKAGDKFAYGTLAAGGLDINPLTKDSLGRLKTFSITQDVTASAATVTVPISEEIVLSGPYQNVSSACTNAQAVTFWPGTTITDGAAKTGRLGVGMTNEAFCFVPIKVPQPKNGEGWEIRGMHTDEQTGLSFAMLGWFNPETMQTQYRGDVFYGKGALRGGDASLLIGSAQ